MANYKTTGGGNLTELYALTSIAWQPDTKVIGLDKKFTTQFAGHEKSKNLEATLTHETFDSTIIGNTTALFDYYLDDVATPSTEKYEDGAPAAGSSNAATTLLAITYSGKSDDSKRLVRAFPCILQGGGYTMEADKTIRPETKLIAVPAGAAISIASSFFHTLITGSTGKTIAKGAYGISFWLTAV